MQRSGEGGVARAVVAKASQYFLAIAPPVEVGRFASRTVQSQCQLDQRLEIKFGPLRPHAGQYLAPVQLPRAIEMREKVLTEFRA